jgi:hypothetical protein
MQIQIPWHAVHATDEGVVLYLTTAPSHAANVLVEGFAGPDKSEIELTNAPRPHGQFTAAVAVVVRVHAAELERFEVATRRGAYRAFRVPLGFVRRHATLRAVAPTEMPVLLSALEVMALDDAEPAPVPHSIHVCSVSIPAAPSPPDGPESVVRGQAGGAR